MIRVEPPYVIVLRKTSEKDTIAHLHCNAALIGPKTLITTLECVEDIEIAFKKDNNLCLPHYHAEIEDIEMTSLQRLSLREATTSTEYVEDGLCGILKVSRQIQIY